MAGDAEHREVIERIKIILADPALPPGLGIGNFRALMAQIGDQPAEIRVAVPGLAHRLHHLAVI